MTFRTWLYDRLTDSVDTEGRTLVGDRVFAKKSMKSSVEDTPYVVYKLGNDTSEALAETSSANRQFFTIYIHDYAEGEVADYLRIDEVIDWLKRRIKGQQSAEDNIIEIFYLETSQDLDDQTLSTVMKYIRFQAILA